MASASELAMGRAIVREPQVFLMDEPLSNLDAKLRVSTRSQIAALQRRLGVTTVYVTHDQVEAMTMGDRVAVLNNGVLQQCASPRALYEQPANAFVAGFIGSPAMNLATGDLVDGGVRLGGTVLPLPRSTANAASADGASTVTLGFRPEALDIVSAGQDSMIGTVTLVEELGSDAYAYCTLTGGDPSRGELDVVARVDPRTCPAAGEQVHLRPRPDAIHAFSVSTGERLTK
ncbi:hypothetical protein GCM10009854_40940 [Saccharopolyspora halophila]|uniref:MalK-like OB fold domain-containing protein n=1 Tax=Saccharopolyspora halophila TaxID=405551 RepID=A0ABN3GQG4_9PSEU